MELLLIIDTLCSNLILKLHFKKIKRLYYGSKIINNNILHLQQIIYTIKMTKFLKIRTKIYEILIVHFIIHITNKQNYKEIKTLRTENFNGKSF